MIENALDDLRKSFHETQRNGGFYGLSTVSETYRNKPMLRIYWHDYLGGTHPNELLSIPETQALPILGELYAELQALREETAKPTLALVA